MQVFVSNIPAFIVELPYAKLALEPFFRSHAIDMGWATIASSLIIEMQSCSVLGGRFSNRCCCFLPRHVVDSAPSVFSTDIEDSSLANDHSLTSRRGGFFLHAQDTIFRYIKSIGWQGGSNAGSWA
jgi:hypothetical protein